MKKKIIAILIAVILLVSLLPIPALALSASASLSGPDVVRAGDTIKLSFAVNGSGLYGVSGSLTYDSSQVELTGTSKSIGSGWLLEFNGGKFAAYDNEMTAPINSRKTIFTATFKVKDVAPGTNVTISCQNVKATDGADEARLGSINYSVTIAEPLSTDNALQSMTVTNAAITPAFSTDVTSYSAQVPFEVSRLDIQAVANDAKATVSVNSPTLTPNGTTKVTVTVRAESGAERTYTISVHRAQDPNYVPSGNNTLASISVEGFLLSPVFTKENRNYMVWVPYEVDSIVITGGAEDRLARVQVEGGSNLVAGADNEVKVICIAENGNQAVYSVIVKRGPAHDPSQEPPTEPPTQPPTEPPTELPTQAPTVPEPTEPAPTQPQPGALEKDVIPVLILGIVIAFLVGVLVGFIANWMLRKKKR